MSLIIIHYKPSLCTTTNSRSNKSLTPQIIRNQTHAKIKPKIHSSHSDPQQNQTQKTFFPSFFYTSSQLRHMKNQTNNHRPPRSTTHANSPITTQSNFYKQTHIWECFKENGKKPSNILQSRDQ
ncbi:hypothetical protein ACJW30_06G078300 [Castanea mollissima]